MPVCQRCRDSSVKHVATHDTVPPAGFEPATHGVETHCSNPLSYGGLQRTHSSPRGRGNLSQGALRRAQDVHQVLGGCGQLAIRAVGHDGVVAG